MRGRLQVRHTDASPHLILHSSAHVAAPFQGLFLSGIRRVLHAGHLELQLFELLLTLIITNFTLPPNILTRTCIICQLKLG